MKKNKDNKVSDPGPPPPSPPGWDEATKSLKASQPQSPDPEKPFPNPTGWPTKSNSRPLDAFEDPIAGGIHDLHKIKQDTRSKIEIEKQLNYPAEQERLGRSVDHMRQAAERARNGHPF